MILRHGLSGLLLSAVLAGCALPNLDDAFKKSVDYKQEVWEKVDGGVTVDLRAVKALDTNRVVAVGDRGTLIKTEDGETFTVSQPEAFAGAPLLELDFLNALIGFVVTQDELFKTEDGGKTWASIKNFQTGYNDALRAVEFVTPGVGFVMGDKALYQTLDGGETWTRAKIEKVSSLAHVGSLMYVAGDQVYKTNLTGTFSGVAAADSICTSERCVTALTFPSEETGILIGGSGDSGGLKDVIFRMTSDGGETWRNSEAVNAYSGKPVRLSRFLDRDARPVVSHADAQQGWLLHGGLYRTYDGWKTVVPQVHTWDPNNNPDHIKFNVKTEPDHWLLRDLAVVDAEHAWIVGGQGVVYRFRGEYYPPVLEEAI